MKYNKEYQAYMKKVTDIFIGKLTHNTAVPITQYSTPNFIRNGDDIIFDYTVDANYNLIESAIDEAPSNFDDVITRPKDVVEAWLKIENIFALKWLNKNAMTYDEWLETFKK